MKLKCNNCGHKETYNKRFFLKGIGWGLMGFGYWAWEAYLFAETGFALPICIVIMAGGVGLAAISDKIAEWVSKKFPCPKCGSQRWTMVDE